MTTSQDLLNQYKAKYTELQALNTIGNRTLTKTREYEIANNTHLKELAQIERLKITVIYLLVCVGVLGLVYIYILPQKLGYALIGLILIAYILTIIFINNNFYKRYNMNYAMFKFYTDTDSDTEVENEENEEPVCITANNVNANNANSAANSAANSVANAIESNSA